MFWSLVYEICDVVAKQSFGQCCTSESFECCYLHVSANILLVFCELLKQACLNNEHAQLC